MTFQLSTGSSSNNNGKSFWSKREGKVGLAVLIALIAGGSWLINTALPLLIKGITNMFVLAGLALLAAGLLYVAFDPKTRAFISYYYKAMFKALVGINPIAVLEGYISNLHDQINEMFKQIGNLSGQIRRLKDIITSNNKEAESNLKLAGKAKEQGQKNMFILKTRKAGRLENSNVPLQTLLNKMEALHAVLLKMHETSKIVLEDMESEVDVKKREYNALKAGYSAFRAATNFINNGNSEREMFEQAMEFLAEDYANKVGEIENFMTASESFIQSVDLQNGVYEEDGLALLEEWEKKTNNLLLPPGEQKEQIPFRTVGSEAKMEEVELKKFEDVNNNFKKFFN